MEYGNKDILIENVSKECKKCKFYFKKNSPCKINPPKFTGGLVFKLFGDVVYRWNCSQFKEAD